MKFLSFIIWCRPVSLGPYSTFLLRVIRSLGTLGQGVSCKVLQESFRADPSRPAVRKILTLLRQQPGPLHTSLVEAPIRTITYSPPAGC